MKKQKYLAILFALSFFLFPSVLLHTKETDIYLAGPLFTLGERQFNAALTERLRGLGHSVFLPQEQELLEWASDCIFSTDVSGIDHARAVVALYDGSDPDSGTCWECGYAYGKGKPVIAVRTDFRGMSDRSLAPYNLMLWESAVTHIQMPSFQYDLQALVDEIHKAIESVLKDQQN